MNGLSRVVLFFLLISSFSVFATTVSEADAYQNALNYQLNRFTIAPTLRLVNMASAGVRLRSNKNPAYYVFNVGQNQGFVIVSGETSTKAILGYSNEGQFQPALLTDNLKAWLDHYEQEIDSVRSATFKTDETSNKSISSLKVSSPVVPPLLNSNRWAQLAPYNLFCPWDYQFQTRSAVGCVALAMGQIMQYHQWPLHPKGSINYYVDNMGLQFVVLDSTTYDWSIMTKPIISNEPATQDTLIANFLHHCGVTVSMQYSASGSAADVVHVGPAMVNNFGYDSDIQHYKRDHFTYLEWQAMLQKELDEERPVLYAAFSKAGGHVFVCDGYDSNYLYHINWGWGGNGNGYYELSSLNSDYPGLTGVADGFNKDQSMLIRIQRPDQTTLITYSIGMLGGNLQAPMSVFNRKNTFPFRFDCRNFGTNLFEGYLGLGYYDRNNQLKLLEKSDTRLETIASGRTKTYDKNTLTLPSTMIEGLYRVYAIYRPVNSMNWSIIHGTNGINLQIGGEIAKFISSVATTILELKTPINILHQVYQNQSAEVFVTFMNNDISYKSTILLDLHSEPGAKFVKTIYQGSHPLQAGTIHTLKLKTEMSCMPGDYSIVARISTPYVQNFFPRLEPYTCNNLKVRVKPAPGPSDLQLVDSMSLHLYQSNHRKDSMTLKAKVSNYGGFTNTTMVGLVFPEMGETCLDTLNSTEIYIDSLETTTLNLKGNVSLRDGSYVIKLCQLTDGTAVPVGPSGFSNISFNIGNPKAGKDSLNLYWHLSDDQLIIDGDHQVEAINLYNVSGIHLKKVDHQDFIPVGSLSKGIYIVKVKMNGIVFFDKYFRK